MKFSMFHLMGSHRELPDDFEKRYHSVWVDPPFHELADAKKFGGYFRASLEEAIYAARAGFDGICTNEHHQNAYGGVPSPNLMGAVLAHATQDTNCALVQMGSTLPTTMPPVRVAEEYAMLDCLSDGRLIAGFPIGTAMDANLCYGVSPIEQRERYYEAYELVHKAWTSRKAFAWNGKYFQLPIVNIWPRPIQEPHPPAWIPGISSVSTWQFAAEHDAAFAFLSAFSGTQGLNGAKTLVNGYWDHMASVGAELNPFRVGFAIPIALSETDAQAERDHAQHVKYFQTKLTHIAPEFWAPPGYYDHRSLTNMMKLFGTANAANSAADLTWGESVRKQLVIAGGPDSVAQQLEEMAKTMRIGHLMTVIPLGSTPTELVKKSVDLFVNEVKPRLAHLWEDEYENRWWPERLRGQSRPAETREPAGVR